MEDRTVKTALDILREIADKYKMEKNNRLEEVKMLTEKLISNRKKYLKVGGVLINDRGGKSVIVFRMFGRLWTTNHNRKTAYKFDDIGWVPYELDIIAKLKMILTKKVKALKE
jgi:hypothetical protein